MTEIEKLLLGQGETPLLRKEVGLSEVLWLLMESGRSIRIWVTLQNMVGYYGDRHLLKLNSVPMLNVDFFGDKDGNRRRLSRGNMPTGLVKMLKLMDAYVPKLDKKA